MSQRVIDHRVPRHRLAFRQAVPEIVRYVKNQNLGFTVALNGEKRNDISDVITCSEDSRKTDNRLNLVGVVGQKRKDAGTKVDATRIFRTRAINSRGSFGQWVFIEVDISWSAEGTSRVIRKKGTTQ
jgi:hypothetical protein